MLTIAKIIEDFEGIRFVGNSAATVQEIIQLNGENKNPHALMWCADKHTDKINKLSTGIVIVSENTSTANQGVNYIVCKNPRQLFSKIVERYFYKKEIHEISQHCVIDSSAILGKNIGIGNFVTIEGNVVIGDNAIIGPNTVIKANTKIGNDVIIGANCTIGSVGFGYEKDNDGQYTFIPHIGNVVIGNNAEIGNNTCIDKAVLGSTNIGENVKIDNLVHIAHGVQIGKNSLIIANAMVAGSVNIGKNVWVAPSSAIINGISIADNSIIGLGAVVIKSAVETQVLVGNPAKNIKK